MPAERPSDEAIDLARGSWLQSTTAEHRSRGFFPPTLPSREEFMADFTGALLARDMQDLLDGVVRCASPPTPPEEPF